MASERKAPGVPKIVRPKEVRVRSFRRRLQIPSVSFGIRLLRNSAEAGSAAAAAAALAAAAGFSPSSGGGSAGAAGASAGPDRAATEGGGPALDLSSLFK